MDQVLPAVRRGVRDGGERQEHRTRATDDFVSGKRTWSRIKDRVLQTYKTPYLTKVKRLRRTVVLIDGYASPRAFEDGSVGSPLVICQAVESCVPSAYHAEFGHAVWVNLYGRTLVR